MTASALLRSLVPLVADLSRDIPERERYRRLLQTLRDLLPCDAAALLRRDGEVLVPLAIDGLAPDTLGRRFRLDEHPRFAVLMAATGPTRFAADSPLPDPYDGLVQHVEGDLDVHDCMGCALHVDGEPWGLLTLDALAPDRFNAEHVAALEAFGNLASATVAAVERLRVLARQACDERQRAEAYRQAARPVARRLTGQSPAFKRLLKDIELVAASELTVLITGETGVGKELVAEALHAGSPRASRPMVSVNCAALPDTLVESELFGHVRGAFTGAGRDRQGKFELADGGTLFLDEVGELPLAVQAKLLRVLQSGQLQRVGSDHEHRVDVRLIAATNRDLAAEVRAGRLRADFYHRLSVYPLQVPPLRERGRDVLVTAGFFLEENRSRLGLGGVRLDAPAQAALLAYSWPGNVRELEHLIGRSILKALGRHSPWPRILTLTVDDLGLAGPSAVAPPGPASAGVSASAVPPRGPGGPSSHPVLASASPSPLAAGAAPSGTQAGPASAAPEGGLRPAVERFERDLIDAALARHAGNRAAAARELGLDRANFARLARRLGVLDPGSGT